MFFAIFFLNKKIQARCREDQMRTIHMYNLLCLLMFYHSSVIFVPEYEFTTQAHY